MKLTVKTIPHKKQDYDTVGNWLFTKNGISCTISNTGRDDYTFLIAIHELIEAFLCRQRGITEEEVTDFDKGFRGEGEPGDNIFAPYHMEHIFATSIETALANELGIDWKEYEDTLNKLVWENQKKSR